MQKNTVQFHKSWIGKEEEQEIIETLRSGWLTTGERTRRFEQEFADYTESKFAVGLNSCTAGLFLALKAFDIKPGDEVITTPMTFTATANVILHCGAKPVFVDIDPADLNIDTEKISEAVTIRTKAVIPVHFRGYPCKMDEIVRIAGNNGLIVIEDAAHAIESRYKEKKIGSIGHASCFSFYPNKNMTTGEGGMLTTNNENIASRVRMLSNHGLSRDSWLRYTPSGKPVYEVIEPGYKYNMFDIQAALGLHQLRKIDEFWRRRKQIVEKYDQAFADFPQLSIPEEEKDWKNAYHIYTLKLVKDQLSITRDELLDKLKEKGIGVSVHFRALHLQKFYRDKFNFTPESFPVASDISERIFSIPLYPKLTDEEVDHVINSVAGVIEKYSK
ncbi:DegT/DnrJ/EryC1/StrS family aminotransferase [candidate division KSB1 bacterium]